MRKLNIEDIRELLHTYMIENNFGLMQLTSAYNYVVNWFNNNKI